MPIVDEISRHIEKTKKEKDEEYKRELVLLLEHLLDKKIYKEYSRNIYCAKDIISLLHGNIELFVHERKRMRRIIEGLTSELEASKQLSISDIKQN